MSVVVSPILHPASSNPHWRRALLAVQCLDLDAPLVAIVWQRMFAGFAHVAISAAATVVLALAVWLIYAGDRLLDVRRDAGFSARHAFHLRHARRFEIAWLCAFALLACVVFALRPRVIEWGVILAGCVGLYLYAVHRLRIPFPKEIAVGALFAAGVVLAPIVRSANPHLLLPSACFLLLCCSNCLAVDAWENGRSLRFEKFLFVPSILFAGQPIFICIAISGAVILLIDAVRHRISPDLSRLFADLALLTPLLFLT